MPYDVMRSNANKPQRRKHAHAATTAPTVSDDGTEGFRVWSSWLDTTGPTLYVCLDVSTGAAVWLELGAGGASALDDLTDVNAPTPADGNVLAWDSTPGEWVPVAPGTPTIDWGEDADITTLDYDDVADEGALAEAARADHRHGMPSASAGDTGYEFDYAQITSNVTITGTAEASETTCITGASVAYDGSTTVIIEVYCPRFDINAASAGNAGIVVLYEDSTILGRIHTRIPTATGVNDGHAFLARLRRTPSNASHQYIVKAYKTSANTVTFGAGVGGTGANVAAYLRVTKG